MIFSVVTILQGVEFPIFLLIFAWALQQCSATALPVIINRFAVIILFSLIVKSFCIGDDSARTLSADHNMRITAQLYTSTAVHLICNGTVPGYQQSCFTRLADMTSRQRLRSSASHRLAVPPVRLSTVGRRAFQVSGASTQRPSIERH